MLKRFLATIQAGDVQSLLEIARKLEVSSYMVLQMAGNLAGRGYLQEISADCHDPQPGCPIVPSPVPARSSSGIGFSRKMAEP